MPSFIYEGNVLLGGMALLKALFCILLLSLLTTRLLCDRERHPNSRNRLEHAWSSLFSSPVPPLADRCLDCVERRAALEKGAAESHLAALRIEFIKKQILKKLRLKEAPTGMSPRVALPKPLASGSILHRPHQTRDTDDFYAKTDQVILFPDIEKVRCMPASQDPTACFTFRLPAELEAEDVTVAQLWFYKERDRLDNHNQTLVISEVALWDRNRSYQKSKLLAIETTSIKEGWIKVNLLWVVKHWLENLELPHAVQIACKTCGMDVPKSPISLLPENKPFLVININSNSQARRPQRNINCAPGLTECCRESLYISFAEIGWDDWILQPPGYHAYFCKGSCSVASSITQSGSHYSSIMQRVLHKTGSDKKPEFVPCCTATRLSPIQLMYMDDKRMISQKTLPNMAVEACGCM